MFNFKKIWYSILVSFLVLSTNSGCARFDPKNKQKIDNENGEIGEIRSNQNGMMLELGKLRQESQIQNSQLKEYQQGLINLNAAISRNENTGTQILQGDGPLVLIFGIVVVGMILYYFRSKTVIATKANEILVNEINKNKDQNLKKNILKAAMYSPCEKEILELLLKK